MKTITVRQLPLTDLTMGFALLNSEGKYDVYTVPLPYAMTKYADKSWEEAAPLALRAYFEKELDSAIDLVVLPSNQLQGTPEGVAQVTTPIDIDFVPKKVLKDLNKVQVKGTLYQYNKKLSIFPTRIAKILDIVANFINRKIISPINARLHTFYGLDVLRQKMIDSNDTFKVTHDDWSEPGPEYQQIIDDYDYAVDSKIFIPLLYSGRFVRAVTPVTYLAVAGGEDDLARLIDSLVADLTILSDKGLIMGNLALPGLTELVNTVGNGKKVYAAYAMPIVNIEKLLSLVGLSWLDYGTNTQMNAIERLGVKNAVWEGGIKYLNDKYPYEELRGKTVSVLTEDNEALVKAYKTMNEKTSAFNAKAKENKKNED